jgi:amino acid adenylation domain-containing protein
LLLSSFAFDSSVAGIFGTLTQGGTLYLPEQRQETGIPALASLIEEYSITHMLCLPSLYMLLLEYAAPSQLRSLETVIVAGEACTLNLVRLHEEVLPETELYNEYGPTEGTVWCSVYHVSPEERRGVIPIGKPIANMRIYILDRHMQPVPVGVAGELYVAGEGVVSGYYRRPDLTASRFLDHSFYGGSVQRLYRTGDLARYLPDGNIEFLGRVDQQVKVRGFRVELEEIESSLAQHPGVFQAVVAALNDAPHVEPGVDTSQGSESLAQALARLDPATAEAILAGVETLSKAEPV